MSMETVSGSSIAAGSMGGVFIECSILFDGVADAPVRRCGASGKAFDETHAG